MSMPELSLLEAAERLARLGYRVARYGGSSIDVAQDLMKTSSHLKAHALALDEQREGLALILTALGDLP